MSGKFKRFLTELGQDFKKALPWLESFGEAAVSAFLPALGPLFNQTVNAVVTVEQKYAALGKQSGTGAQKLADVVEIMGPLVAVALQDAGKASDEAAVENYINSVVEILNTTPAPEIQAPAASS